MSLFLAAAILLLASCGKASPSSTIAPEAATATPGPTVWPPPVVSSETLAQDTAYWAVQPNVVSTIEAVEEKVGSFVLKGAAPVSGTKKRQDLLYSEWSARVERYLTEPLALKRVRLLRIEGWTYEGRPPTHPEGRQHLFPGERAIFFLMKQIHERLPLREDQFWVQIMVPIVEGKVNVIRGGQSVEEPVEEFVRRLQGYGQDAGWIMSTQQGKEQGKE